MYSIFFDLETSDTNPVGQILNFCFIFLNPDYEEIDRLTGEIKISRLQLPRAEAILANRINVIEHQKRAAFTEREAMFKIDSFLRSSAQHCGAKKAALIGYNSARFDLGFLRTSLIRNGFNPYYPLLYRDLLLASRKLATARQEFSKLCRKVVDTEEKFSLSLETLCSAFGILHGAQTHESTDDVLLTIELAKTYKERFGLDVRNFRPYEVMGAKKGSVIFRLLPNYDLQNNGGPVKIPMALLDSDQRYALWIDLDAYSKGKQNSEENIRPIRWFKYDGHDFFSDGDEIKDPELLKLSAAALEEFRGVNLKNFFTESDCDIEQDIYRIDFSGIDLLHELFWGTSNPKLPSRDLQIVASRFKLANYEYGGASDAKVDELLAKYACYRYGGRLKLIRGEPDKTDVEANTGSGYHPSFEELVNGIDNALSEASSEDRELLRALKAFYFDSDIYRQIKETFMCNRSDENKD